MSERIGDSKVNICAFNQLNLKCNFFFLSLPVSNLKKIIETIFDYYGEILNITLNEFGRPNAMKIAETNDPNELGRLMQLILGKFP